VVKSYPIRGAGGRRQAECHKMLIYNESGNGGIEVVKRDEGVL